MNVLKRCEKGDKKLKNISGIMFNYFKKIVLVLLFASLVFSFYFSLFSLKETSLYVTKIIQNPEYMIFISFVLVALSVLVIFRYMDCFSSGKNRYVKIILWSVLILGQFFVLYMFKTAPRTDSFLVQDQALAIVEKIDSKIDYRSTWYFTRYGNNNFYLIISMWLYKVCKLFHIEDWIRVFAAFNIVLIDLSVFLTCRIARLFSETALENKVLLLSVLNPLNYLMIYWTYTCTYSTVVGIAIIYFFVSVIENKNNMLKGIIYTAMGGMLTVVGFFLRPTTLIPLIALICCLRIYKKERGDRKRRVVVLIISLIISMLVSWGVMIKGIEKYTDPEGIEQNFPITHWVMMGLHESGKVNSEDNAFTAQFDTKEEKQEADIGEIIKTVKDYGPSGILNHYIKKLRLTWSDGASEYYTRLNTDLKFSRAYKWIAGERKDFVVIYCVAYRILILGLAMFSVWQQIINNQKEKLFQISLTIFGAMVFYFLWEGKSAYSIPFLPFLILLAEDGVEFIQKKDIVLPKKKVQYFMLGGLVITIVLSICNYWNFVKKESVWTSYSVIFTDQSVMKNEENISELDKELIQEFYTRKPFNEISIHCETIDSHACDYSIQLIAGGVVEEQFHVSEEDVKSGRITLRFPTIYPDKKEKYQILIAGEMAGDKDSIIWKRRFSKTLGSYEGKCIINGERENSDLALNVYLQEVDTYMDAKVYWILIIFTVAWEIILCYFLLKMKSYNGLKNSDRL